MFSIQHGPKNGESAKVPFAALKFHTPAKCGDRSWRIVNEETGEIVDSYSPPRIHRDKPICSYERSWAHEEELRRALPTKRVSPSGMPTIMQNLQVLINYLGPKGPSF